MAAAVVAAAAAVAEDRQKAPGAIAPLRVSANRSGMIVELLVFAMAIVVPFVAGFALAHFRPQSRNLKNAAAAALPVSLPFFTWAIWVTFMQDMNCTPEPCETMAPLWAMALYVIGVLTGVTGFGVGLLGDAYARNRAGSGTQ